MEILTSRALFEENGGFFSCGFTIILLSVVRAARRFGVGATRFEARRQSERRPQEMNARRRASRSSEFLNVRKGFLK
jgi:hypothetical protein